METVPEIPKYTLSPEEENKEILRRYRGLLRSLKPKIKMGDKELLRKAFEMAVEGHKTMRRKSGEPYILHPIAVAQICIDEIGLGVRSTICALLHDTVEDTDITLADIQREFGNEIAKIVDGLTKIGTAVIDPNSSQQVENFKKILITLTDDPRVILIKLSDRLHNMRTMDSMKREKQLKISSETIYVYSPLAHRMGLYSLKSELEDLSMKYMEPDTYKYIAQKLNDTKKERSKYINDFIRPIKDKLTRASLNFEIYGRPKSIHSIHNKMKTKGVAFEEVYDLFAIRIIVDAIPEKEKEECWKVYSIITDEYTPSTERLRDWLSKPKSNGYEALHTTVMGPEGRWVEVQVRTKRMNEIAEKGLAAHWKYKEGKEDESRFDAWFSEIREILNQENSSLDFLQDFKTSFLVEEIYVYTPKGDVKTLPIGATALDFAFGVHTAVGSKTIGAKVNHKLVPIGHKLKSGDQIEIITSAKQKPSSEWLNLVITTKAKTKIKDCLKEEKRIVAEEGKYILQRKLEGMGASMAQSNLEELAVFYKVSSSLDLLHDITVKKIDLKELKEFTVAGEKLMPPKPIKVIVEEKPISETKKTLPKKDTELIIFGESSDQIMYSLANCCKPIPGDDVFGFVTTGEGLKIHRTNCNNATRLMANYGHRVVKTKWAKNKEISFLTGLNIIGLDDVGVIHKITNLISGEMKFNINAMSIEAKDGIFKGNLRIFVHDKDELDELVQRLKDLDGIESVDRYDTE